MDMVIFQVKERLRMIRRSREGIISINEADSLDLEMIVKLLIVDV